MRTVTTEFGELRQYLKSEFGSFIECPRGGCVVAPPIGIPFEVVEPLQTEPHPVEISRNDEFGLTQDSCIPVGVYGGIGKHGILPGTSTHSLCIELPKNCWGKRVVVRMATGNIDWRGVKAIKT